LSIRTFLVHGLVAGLVAGIAAFIVGYTVAEPQIDRAIAVEEAAAQAEMADMPGMAGMEMDEPVVSRGTQSTWGLATMTLGIGIVLGGITGIVSAIGLGRFGSLRPTSSTALVVALAAVSYSIVPFLKYPAAPPAVGSGETTAERSALFFGFLAISLLAMVVAVAVARRGSRHWGGLPGILAGAGTYVVVVAVAAIALPKVDELGSFPASILWDFRVSSLLTLLTTWAAIGVVLTVLVDRTWRRASEDEARRELAASL
jgi:hypothetical protein